MGKIDITYRLYRPIDSIDRLTKSFESLIVFMSYKRLHIEEFQTDFSCISPLTKIHLIGCRPIVVETRDKLKNTIENTFKIERYAYLKLHILQMSSGIDRINVRK